MKQTGLASEGFFIEQRDDSLRRDALAIFHLKK